MPTTATFQSFPNTIAFTGGDLLTVVRLWPTTKLPLACRLEVADVALPCAAARSDQGTDLLPVGRVVRLAMPALPRRLWSPQPATLRFVDTTGSTVFALPIAVGPPLYDSLTYPLRANLPPRWATGPRSVLDEPGSRDTDLRAVTGALGRALSLFGGQRQTRLTAPAARGDRVLNVERTAELPDPGRVSVGRVTYRCRNNTPTQLRNLQAEVHGQWVDGALGDHLDGAPVTDVSERFSELDALRRAFFIDTAESTDLAVIGRTLGVPRSPSLTGDQQYRDLIKALGYAARGSEKTLTEVLDILVGPDKYELQKDPFKSPGQVVVVLPQQEPVSTVSMGRAYLVGDEPLAPQGGGFVLPKPVLSHGAIVGAADAVAQELLATAPAAAVWAYSADRAAYLTVGAGRDGTSWGGLRGTLSSQPRGVARTGRLTVAFLGAFVPPSGAGSRDLVQMVADNGDRRAIAILAATATGLTARLVAQDGSALTATVPVPGGPATAHHWQLALAGTTARLGCDGALVAQATATAASTAPGVRLLSAKASDTTWDLRLRWLMRGFTGTADLWAGRATATAQSVDTVGLDQALLVAGDVGKVVYLGQDPYEIAAVVDPKTAKLRRPLGQGGRIRRASNVSYLDAGDQPLRYPSDVGGSVEVVTANAQSAGTFQIVALYEAGTGRDLATYQTRLATSAASAKLIGNPQPIAQVPYRLAMRLKAADTFAFLLSDAGTVEMGDDTVTITPRQSLPDEAASYRLNFSSVLSGQLFAATGPDVKQLTQVPPQQFSSYPFYIYDPYDLVETYLPSVVPVGSSVQVRR